MRLLSQMNNGQAWSLSAHSPTRSGTRTYPPTDKLSSDASAFESEDGAFADQKRYTAQNAEAAVDETPR